MKATILAVMILSVVGLSPANAETMSHETVNVSQCKPGFTELKTGSGDDDYICVNTDLLGWFRGLSLPDWGGGDTGGGGDGGSSTDPDPKPDCLENNVTSYAECTSEECKKAGGGCECCDNVMENRQAIAESTYETCMKNMYDVSIKECEYNYKEREGVDLFPGFFEGVLSTLGWGGCGCDLNFDPFNPAEFREDPYGNLDCRSCALCFMSGVGDEKVKLGVDIGVDLGAEWANKGFDGYASACRDVRNALTNLKSYGDCKTAVGGCPSKLLVDWALTIPASFGVEL